MKTGWAVRQTEPEDVFRMAVSRVEAFSIAKLYCKPGEDNKIVNL